MWPLLLCTTKCCAGANSPTKMALSNSSVFYFIRTRGPGFCALPNAAQVQRVQQKWRCCTQVFLLLQDTWPRFLYTLKCGAGAESLTKMVLSYSRASYFCRTHGPGFCTLSNAAQAQRVQQRWRCYTHLIPPSAGHVALASVHYQMLCRRRESNKDGTFALTCFLLLQYTWVWLLCTTKCCAGAESLTKMALSHSHASYFCRTRGPGFCVLSNAAQAQRV
jgi:hypothetical protein